MKCLSCVTHTHCGICNDRLCILCLGEDICKIKGHYCFDDINYCEVCWNERGH